MSEFLNPPLATVTDGKAGVVSLRDRLLEITLNSGVQLLLWALVGGVVLRWIGLPADALVLSGEAFWRGSWWTLATYLFANESLILLYGSFLLLFAGATGLGPTAAGRNASIGENMRRGGRLIFTVLLCGIAGGVAFLVVDTGRAAPLEGFLPAVLGLIAYRTVRWRRRGDPSPAQRPSTSRFEAVGLALVSIGLGYQGSIGAWLLDFPAVATLARYMGGPWPAVAVAILLIIAVVLVRPGMFVWVFVATILWTLVAKWSVILDWLTTGPMPWEALLGGLVAGALLGLLFPALLPGDSPAETT